jgi:hypothetical protein
MQRTTNYLKLLKTTHQKHTAESHSQMPHLYGEAVHTDYDTNTRLNFLQMNDLPPFIHTYLSQASN